MFGFNCFLSIAFEIFLLSNKLVNGIALEKAIKLIFPQLQMHVTYSYQFIIFGCRWI